MHFSLFFVLFLLQVYEVESFVTETGGTPEPRPFFEDPESNVTVQLGAEVYLHCRIQNLQNNLKVKSHFHSLLRKKFNVMRKTCRLSLDAVSNIYATCPTCGRIDINFPNFYVLQEIVFFFWAKICISFYDLYVTSGNGSNKFISHC